MFAATAVAISFFFYFRARTRAQVQQTIRVALEKGESLSPEILQQLTASLDTQGSDLRRGVISVAVAFGFAAFALILGEHDALRPLLAVGTFPLMLGLAYLGLWRFRD